MTEHARPVPTPGRFSFKAPAAAISGSPSTPATPRLTTLRKLHGGDLPTASQGAESARDMRLKMLASARGLLNPGRIPLPDRVPGLAVTFWEIFGRHGSRVDQVITPYLCWGERILKHRAAA